MKKQIANFIFFISGWKTIYSPECKVDKCVMIAAPHTSNWDFIYTLAIFWQREIDIKFFMKDSMANGAFGWFFRSLGAIGVNRKKHNNLVEYAAELLTNTDKLVLLVPAEGTRKRVEKWRKGFYYIAKKANVPVVLGYLDYPKKLGGIEMIINLSDSFEKDMLFIQNYYKDIQGKNPENYNPKIY